MGGDGREPGPEEYEHWGEVWAVASDFRGLFNLYEQWAELGKDDLRLFIADELREKLEELREEVAGAELAAAREENERLQRENEARKRAYEEFIDDVVWLKDEGETETISVNKALLGALIDAFDRPAGGEDV